MGTDSPRSAAAPGDDAAARLLAKLRAFIGALEPDERAALAALLAPGVAAAQRADGDPAAGGRPGPVAWDADRLADSVRARVRRHLRIEFD